MTVDASKPLDTEFGSNIPAYLRETRAQANAAELIAGGAGLPVQSDVDLTPGQTTLVVGTHVSEAALDIVHLDAAAAEIVQLITHGTGGQVKVIVAEGNNVTIRHDGVNITLNGNDNLPMQTNDVLVLVNIGGAGDGVTNGNWVETSRVIRV